MTAPLEKDIQQDFREAMASVATPVSVVTTTWEGEHYGATVSAFSSLSMDPPMVLVSLDKRSALLTAMRSAGRFGLNILAASQASTASRFASGRGVGKFEGVKWRPDAGLPRIDGALSWLACDVVEVVEGGDHLIALGAVASVEACEGFPLTYHRRVFGTHLAL
ncbi:MULTISPECIES: flavin reductase [unclassified Rhodococcus (in: high G+C Gram-positive bacteria)]|uniref:flavin reductase family protein n=1 Tax=Rhodococcus sp. SJ-3 TaxID=3454628 RepID=UPI003F7AEBF9